MLARLAMTSVAGVLIGVAIGGISLASSSVSQVAGPQWSTLQLLEFQRSFVPEDGKESNHAGSLAAIHSVLKTQAGHKVGRSDFECTELSLAPKGVYHCEGTDTFSDGSTIEFAGLGKFSQLDFTVTVTGGTGQYLGTRGQVFIHSLNSTGTKNLDTFTLSG
jgi:hypothetical protein